MNVIHTIVTITGDYTQVSMPLLSQQTVSNSKLLMQPS